VKGKQGPKCDCGHPKSQHWNGEMSCRWRGRKVKADCLCIVFIRDKRQRRKEER